MFIIMLSAWIQSSVISALQNLNASVYNTNSSCLQVLVFDDSRYDMKLADAEFVIRGILSPMCKDKILAKNPMPEEHVSSGMLIPRSFCYSKAVHYMEDGSCIFNRGD